MNTFETPKWAKAAAARLYLRQSDTGRRVEPTLTDDQVIELAIAVVKELHTEESDE